MARTVNEQEYAVKRAEILDVTWRLMYSKGYDQITIKDIIDELKISKGAFYHYFSSKQDLLAALLGRMRGQGERLFNQILQEPDTPTIAKLQHFFDAAGRWKIAQKENILSLLRSWYADENAVVRLHVQESMLEYIGPMLSKLISQGVAEGDLNTPFPDIAGMIVVSMLVRLGDTFSSILLEPAQHPDPLGTTERMVVAYNDAMERVLGAQPGSLHLIDAETTREWFVAGGAL